MKKFLLKILIFSITTYSAVRILGEFDNTCPNENHNVKRIKASIHYDSLDYLFVGNSFTYSGIMPSMFDELGKRSFNLGFASAGPYYIEMVIDDYLKSVRCHPKNIIFPINFLMFTDKSDNWSLYPIHRNLNNPTSNEEVSIKYTSLKSYPAMLNNSFKKGINCLLKRESFQHGEPQSSTNPELKGFLPSEQIYSPNMVRADLKFYQSLKNENFNFEKFEFFKSLLDKYQQIGIKVIICDIPTFKLKNYFSKQFLKVYQRKIYELQMNSVSITVPDLSDSVYFRNLDHLNSRGAVLFTRQLILHLN